MSMDEKLDNLLKYMRYMDVLEFVLKIREFPNINICTEVVKCTLLARAAECGRFDMVSILLDMGADPNVEVHSDTPLGSAVRLSDVEMVDALLKAGADPHSKPRFVQDTHEATHINVAVNQGDAEIAKLLIAAGGDPHIPDSKGHSNLLIAVKYGDVVMAKLLAEHGLDVNTRGSWGIGFSPWITAKISKNEEMIGALRPYKQKKSSVAL